LDGQWRVVGDSSDATPLFYLQPSASPCVIGLVVLRCALCATVSLRGPASTWAATNYCSAPVHRARYPVDPPADCCTHTGHTGHTGHNGQHVALNILSTPVLVLLMELAMPSEEYLLLLAAPLLSYYSQHNRKNTEMERFVAFVLSHSSTLVIVSALGWSVQRRVLCLAVSR
jgi:hypothetical protein